MATSTWKSKLGKTYNKAEIEQHEQKYKTELDTIRRTADNRICADCVYEPSVWASVNLGVFLCIRCASIHRGIGTHISVPKGCTGTYLWGPDEIQHMKSHGNALVNSVYGGYEFRPPKEADDFKWKQYILDKYEHRKFMQSTQSEHYLGNIQGSISNNNQSRIHSDLITFDQIQGGSSMRMTTKDLKKEPDDFFSQFGV